MFFSHIKSKRKNQQIFWKSTWKSKNVLMPCGVYGCFFLLSQHTRLLIFYLFYVCLFLMLFYSKLERARVWSTEIERECVCGNFISDFHMITAFFVCQTNGIIYILYDSFLAWLGFDWLSLAIRIFFSLELHT